MPILRIGDPETGGFNGGIKLGFSNNGIQPNESPSTYGFLVSDSGISSCSGMVAENNTEPISGKPNLGLFRYDDGANFHTLAKYDTEIFDVLPTGSSTVFASGLPAAADVNFEAWKQHYFFCDGANLWAGTNGAASVVTLLDQNGNAITGTKPQGDYVAQHMQRLWILNKKNQTLAFSETDYFDRWHCNSQTGNFDNLLDNTFDVLDGNPLTAIIRYNDKLMVFKENKVWFGLGDDADGNLQFPFMGKFGALSQSAVCLCDDGFLRGIDLLGVWQYSDQTGFKRISRNIDYELREIDPANRSNVCVGFWWKYFCVSYAYGTGPTPNNRVFIADIIKWDQEGYPCWVQRQGWSIGRFAYYPDTDTLHGASTTGGFIYRLFYGLNDNNQPISAFWQSKRFQAAPGYICQLNSIIVVVREGFNFSITLTNDQNRSYSMVITELGGVIFLRDESNPLLNDFMLSDENDNPMTGDYLIDETEIDLNPVYRKVRVPGGKLNFNELQVSISQNDFLSLKIDYIEIHYTILRAVI